jgi:hypothetical protein
MPVCKLVKNLHKTLTLLAVTGCALGLTLPTNAQIAKVGGAAGLTQLVAPANVRVGQHTSDTDYFWFAENRDVAVSSFNVNSYMLYTDTTGRAQVYNIIVQFDEQILGIITDKPTLDATDSILGLSGTTYPGPAAPRGQDGFDFVIWDVPNNALIIHQRTLRSVDEIRVVTLAVPEPGTLGLLAGLGTTSIVLFRRRKRV